jgi:TPR repeat protein
VSQFRIGLALTAILMGSAIAAESIDLAGHGSSALIKQGETLFSAGKLVEACRILAKNAKQGDASIWLMTGRCYEQWKGLPQNLTEAFRWYRESALHGNTEAENKVGEMLLAGRGTVINLPGAAVLFERAARKGHPDAQFHLGSLYQNGTGVKSDPTAAFELFAASAESGNIEAQYALAKGLLHQSANQGLPEAKELLTRIGAW